MEHALQKNTTAVIPKKQGRFFGKRNDQSFFSPAFIQPKLTIGHVDDAYEREADAVAEKIMRVDNKDWLQTKISPVNIQRKCAHCEEEEKKIQMKGKAGANGGMDAPSVVHETINSGGLPMDAGTRNFMESRFGYDFGNVRVHNDSLAHSSSSEINALAYTHRNHIVFGAGQYQPHTNAGKKLLTHELTHVIQQSAGPSSSLQRQPAVPVYDDYEKYVAQKKWCRDSKESGKLHPGLQCYREIPVSKGHPPGKQYCFDIDTHEYKESSPDFVSAVSGQLSDGTCDIPMKLTDPPQPFTQRGRRSLGHLIGDIATEDPDLIGEGVGAFSGIAMGIGLPKDGFGAGSIVIPAILGSFGFLLGRKGLPRLNRLAERHGFLPTLSLGVSSGLDLGIGVGFEQRRRPLPLVPVNSYLTFGIDSTIGRDDSSIIANVGVRIDPGKQGGLFGFGSAGTGLHAGGHDAGPVGALQAGVGYRFTDFMDVQVLRETVYGDEGKDATYWVTLKLVAPQNVLKGHPK